MNEQQLFLLFILCTVLLTAFAISICVLLVVHKQKQVKHKNDLLKIRLDEQEQSMQLISEEIHDNVGQVLSLARLSLHNISKYLSDPQGEFFINKTGELLTTAIGDLRHISHSLNSDLIQQTGLSASLERQMTHMQDSLEIHCSFEIQGEPFVFEREQNLLIFRIVQESLQNVIKHSEATHVLLSLQYLQDRLKINIEDNGKGFDPVKAKAANSLGLKNIMKRVSLLRAEINILSERGKGTTLLIEIPRTKTTHA